MKYACGWCLSALLLLGASVCSAQGLPSPRVVPFAPQPGPAPGHELMPPAVGSKPAPSRPTAPAGTLGTITLEPDAGLSRNPFPPPAPALVDPRTGAWQQVRILPGPGGCPGLMAADEWVRVGEPCKRCHLGCPPRPASYSCWAKIRKALGHVVPGHAAAPAAPACETCGGPGVTPPPMPPGAGMGWVTEGPPSANWAYPYPGAMGLH